MDWNTVIGFLVGSGIVGAVSAWIRERDARRHEHALATRSAIDLSLRELRLPAFIELWKLTGVLPRWPREKNRTYEDLLKFSKDLRSWYFEQGGWLLSREARKSYGDVQEGLWNALTGVMWAESEGGGGAIRKGPLEDGDYDLVMERCSALRTMLTEDLESRLAGPISGTGRGLIERPF